jgi:sialate O-acetylesterase
VPKAVLESRPEYALFLDPGKNNNYKPVNGEPNPARPVALYNGTIHPLMPFGIKGVLWYQGESDSRYADTYRLLFPDLIRAWRAEWGQGVFPFIFAQLSSNEDRSWSAAFEPKECAWAWLREAQTCGLNEPNTAMIVIYDIGEWEDIHPQDKDEVGRRFALAVAALEDNTVIAQGPVYKSHEIRKQRIIVSFDNLEGGLLAKEVRMNKNKGLAPGSDPEAFVAPADQLVGFTICGPDRVFYEAKAVINPKGDAVIVGSPKVTEPVAVRYAWATFALANLYNQAGLPAHPFRTDDFSMPKLEATKKNK